MTNRTRWIPWFCFGLVCLGTPARGEDPQSSPTPAAPAWTDGAQLLARVEDIRSIRTAEDLKVMGAAAEAGMSAHPDDPRWKLAWVLIEAYSGRAKGVVDAAEELAKALPADAHAQYALGLCLISSMDDVAMWNMGARADRAKSQWLKALELDPTYVSARISLIEFYRRAPGIAGGSTKKAREMAEALAAQPDSAHLGHLFLAEMAGEDKKWDVFDAEIVVARDLAPTDAAREQIMLSQALTLLNEKKDPEATLAVAKPLADAGGDYRFSFACGRALRELDRCADAVTYYRRVIEAMPKAENSRLDLGLCLAEMGEIAEAREHIERYVSDFPEGSRVKEANKALKGLGKPR